MHLFSDDNRANLPTIEGLLISRRRHEYLVALPQLLLAAGGNPVDLEAPRAAIPRERVAFYEVVA